MKYSWMLYPLIILMETLMCVPLTSTPMTTKQFNLLYISSFTDNHHSQQISQSNHYTNLIISDGLRISVLVQMNETLPYWPSINSWRRKCSPRRSRAVLSLTARWILDTTQTALQFFRYWNYTYQWQHVLTLQPKPLTSPN